MRALLAFGLVVMLGCAPGADHPQYTTDGSLPDPIGAGGGPLGDGGVDAGPDAGPDSGFVTDGGCAGAFARPIASSLDFCFTSGGHSTASLTGNCDTAVLVAGQMSCSGTLSGPLDAFDGGCSIPGGTGTCTAPSLPGRVDCSLPSSTGCYFIVCGPGPDAGCGP
jgi:hypothetical protein